MDPDDTTDCESDRRRRRLDRIARLTAAGGDGSTSSTDRRDDSPGRGPEPTQSVERAEAAQGSETEVGPEIEFPDGTRHRVEEVIVLGRRPDPARAREPDAVALAFDAAPSVSRTHLCVRREGRRLLVTDCSSSAGTALRRSGDSVPVPLAPWAQVVVGDGDRLYLGSESTVLTVHQP